LLRHNAFARLRFFKGGLAGALRPIYVIKSPIARNVKAASGKMNNKIKLIQILRAFDNPDAVFSRKYIIHPIDKYAEQPNSYALIRLRRR
jgi:hypothetical protein